mgnify:CR=1 FL=1
MSMQQMLIAMAGAGKDSYWISLFNYGSATAEDWLGIGFDFDSSDNIYLQVINWTNSRPFYKLDNDGVLQGNIQQVSSSYKAPYGVAVAKEVSHSTYNSGTPYDALMMAHGTSSYGSVLKLDMSNLGYQEETGGTYTAWNDSGNAICGGAYRTYIYESQNNKVPVFWGAGTSGYIFRGSFSYNQEGTSSSNSTRIYRSNGMHGWGRCKVYENSSYREIRAWNTCAIEEGSDSYGSQPNYSPYIQWFGGYYSPNNGGGFRGLIMRSNGHNSNGGSSNNKSAFSIDWAQYILPRHANGTVGGTLLRGGNATDASHVWTASRQYWNDSNGTRMNSEGVITKHTVSGTLQWVGVLSDNAGGETGNDFVYFKDCVTDGSGNIYAFGVFGENAWGTPAGDGIVVVKVNSSGSLDWQRLIYRTDSNYRMAHDAYNGTMKMNSQGSLVMSCSWLGSTYNSSGATGKHMAMTIKLPADGSITGTFSSNSNGGTSGNGWVISASSFNWRTSTTSGGNNCPSFVSVSMHGNNYNYASAQDMYIRNNGSTYSGPSEWEKKDL